MNFVKKSSGKPKWKSSRARATPWRKKNFTGNFGRPRKNWRQKNAARSENGSTVKSTIYAWTCAWRRPLPHASCWEILLPPCACVVGWSQCLWFNNWETTWSAPLTTGAREIPSTDLEITSTVAARWVSTVKLFVSSQLKKRWDFSTCHCQDKGQSSSTFSTITLYGKVLTKCDS